MYILTWYKQGVLVLYYERTRKISPPQYLSTSVKSSQAVRSQEGKKAPTNRRVSRASLRAEVGVQGFGQFLNEVEDHKGRMYHKDHKYPSET